MRNKLWLFAVALAAFLAVVAGCGGSASASCPPPVTQTSTEFQAATEQIEAFVIEKSQGVRLTKQQAEIGAAFTYSVITATYDSATIALQIQVGVGLETPFGAYFEDESKTSTYKLVLTRDCAGDDYQLTQVEKVKNGSDLSSELVKVVNQRAKVVYGDAN